MTGLLCELPLGYSRVTCPSRQSASSGRKIWASKQSQIYCSAWQRFDRMVLLLLVDFTTLANTRKTIICRESNLSLFRRRTKRTRVSITRLYNSNNPRSLYDDIIVLRPRIEPGTFTWQVEILTTILPRKSTESSD
jgi:hypothetical protein